MLQASKDCQGLADYLRHFDPVLDCLQVVEALEIEAYDVIAQAAEENVIYIKVRFAPLLSTLNGLSCDTVIEAVLKGLAKGEKECGVKASALLCACAINQKKAIVKSSKSPKNILTKVYPASI